MCKLFHYKDRSIIFPDLCSRLWFLRENSLSQLSRFTFLFTLLFTFLYTRCCCSPGELLGGGRVTSSATGVSDDFYAVEREERNVRLGEYSVIGTSVEGRKTSSPLSLSGKNGSKSGEAAFAGEAERKPGRSAGSSGSKSGSHDESWRIEEYWRMKNCS